MRNIARLQLGQRNMQQLTL